MSEEAIQYVMDFYKIDRETAIKLYSDEISAMEQLWKFEI
jgi:hypothetical protein